MKDAKIKKFFLLTGAVIGFSIFSAQAMDLPLEESAKPLRVRIVKNEPANQFQPYNLYTTAGDIRQSIRTGVLLSVLEEPGIFYKASCLQDSGTIPDSTELRFHLASSYSKCFVCLKHNATDHFYAQLRCTQN
jgi:hypothetical protein